MGGFWAVCTPLPSGLQLHPGRGREGSGSRSRGGPGRPWVTRGHEDERYGANTSFLVNNPPSSVSSLSRGW